MPNMSSRIRETVSGAPAEVCGHMEDSLLLYHPWHIPFGGGELRLFFDAADNGPVGQMPDNARSVLIWEVARRESR